VCGIVGYVGQRPARDALLASLERLEYRGYDSAGLSVLRDGRVETLRAVGNLSALRAKVSSELSHRGCSDAVLMTGVLDHAQALRLLACADVCVSPHLPNPDGSRFFGSPTKLFEYMGLGKAIVASDLEQIGDVIEHERTGLLCEPGDVHCASQGVIRLLRNGDLRDRLGSAALEEAHRHYTWDAHTRRILDALAEGVGS